MSEMTGAAKLLTSHFRRRRLSNRHAQIYALHSNPNLFSQGNEVDDGADLHFLHQPKPVGFDCASSRAQYLSHCLVTFAANDEFKDLALGRCQCCDTRSNNFQEHALNLELRCDAR